MARIKIIPEAKKPSVPSSADANRTVPRFRPPGGPVPLPLDKSYNKQGPK